MVKTALVEQDIRNGRVLLDALSESGFAILTAFWLYLPEPDEWRLFIASPIVERHGSLEAYRRIQALLRGALNELHFPLSDVSVLGPHEGLAETVQSISWDSTGLPGVRLSHLGAKGVYLDDIYIYNLSHRPAPLTPAGGSP